MVTPFRTSKVARSTSRSFNSGGAIVNTQNAKEKCRFCAAPMGRERAVHHGNAKPATVVAVELAVKAVAAGAAAPATRELALLMMNAELGYDPM